MVVFWNHKWRTGNVLVCCTSAINKSILNSLKSVIKEDNTPEDIHLEDNPLRNIVICCRYLSRQHSHVCLEWSLWQKWTHQVTSHGPLADGGKGKFSLIQYLKGTLVNQQGYPTRHICYSFTLFKRRYTLYPFNFKKMSSDKLTIGIAPFMKKNNLTSSPCYYTMESTKPLRENAIR